MTAQIRPPEESEREAVGEVLETSLNMDPGRRASRLARMPLADFRVAVKAERVVSTAAEYRFVQWFGGRAVGMSGIFGVATLPEFRGAGVMRSVVTTVMREAHARGTPITALYPAVLGPYRALGYEIAGIYHQHRLRIDAIPANVGDASLVREFRPEDLPAVRTCWSSAIRNANGPAEPTGDGWWVHRTFNPGMHPTLRAVVVPGEDGSVDAFASFTRSSTPGLLDVAFGLDCEPMAAVTERGLRALLAYYRGYRGIGEWVDWAGPPNDPVAMLMPEQGISSNWRYPWMLRLLHVGRALRGRGWPAGASAEAVFSVQDDLFPDNAGPWRLTVRDGEAEVTRETGDRAVRPLPIGALSAMFTGALRPESAVALGLMDPDDPAVRSFATLFSGPDPWAGLFF